MTLALDHQDDCLALADWQADCSCGVGIATMEISVSRVSVVPVSMAALLVELGLSPSKSAGHRLISQGAVEVVDNQERRTARFKEYLPPQFVLRCGRAWRRVTLL
jgi:tyrosyl-tRNA synthetase